MGVCNRSMFCCPLFYVYSSFAIILVGKREQFVFLMSRDCCIALPRGAMGLFAVCDCGISLSYSLTIVKYMRSLLLRKFMYARMTRFQTIS